MSMKTTGHFYTKSLKKLISEVSLDSFESLKALIKEKYAIFCRNLRKFLDVVFAICYWNEYN